MIVSASNVTQSKSIRTINLDRAEVFTLLCTALGLDTEGTEMKAQGLTNITLIETALSDSVFDNSIFVGKPE